MVQEKSGLKGNDVGLFKLAVLGGFAIPSSFNKSFRHLHRVRARQNRFSCSGAAIGQVGNGPSRTDQDPGHSRPFGSLLQVRLGWIA